MTGLPPLNTNVPCCSRHLHLAKSLQQPNRFCGTTNSGMFHPLSFT
uniref:Uncharacterized protein n=1 Tax=Anguilla anguilla TaxID=7936 RepID=A0A0E9S4U0_ANGAN